MHRIELIWRVVARAANPVVLILLFVAGWSFVQLDKRARLLNVPPPSDWMSSATPEDLLEIPGHEVTYWGDPAARYSVDATRGKTTPVAVVVHFTAAKPVLHLVNYGHLPDFSRGGNSFGYHFYIGRGGGIAQGAPLSKRTNHIKPPKRAQRTRTARHLWSGNTIALSLVGGCDALLRPRWGRWTYCSEEYATPEQLRAGLAVIRAIQKRFDIPCQEVYGHGDLQTDRARFEGATLKGLVLESCPETPAAS